MLTFTTLFTTELCLAIDPQIFLPHESFDILAYGQQDSRVNSSETNIPSQRTSLFVFAEVLAEQDQYMCETSVEDLHMSSFQDNDATSEHAFEPLWQSMRNERVASD
jgi:hypothetical protein